MGETCGALQEVLNQLPCRKDEIQQLTQLFGKPEAYAPPALFIYGHTSTGKSAVVNRLLRQFNLPHALVNCIECYTSRLLFEEILNQLSGQEPSMKNDYTPYSRCDNANDFVKTMRNLILETPELSKQSVYIVLDKAERLRELDVNLLPALLRLQELVGANLSVILLSEIVWDKYRTGTGFAEPYVVHFRDYTREELLEVMQLDCPDGYDEEFYGTYLNLLLSVFHLVCRNLSELRHLARLNFTKYTEPITAGEVKPGEFRKLWKNIEPHLKKALQTVYLREVSSGQWEKMQQEAETSMTVTNLGSNRGSIELPFYSKYLLIAAYLASYNPAKTDKRFFVKRAAKFNKRANLSAAKRHERTSSQLLGPKPFALDRLMAIFYSIVEVKVAPTANIFMQISSLVTLGLLAQLVSADVLDSPKYKCLVSLTFIKAVARTVNFEVVRYLYDFV